MQLDDFIQSALVQIATGVYQANATLTGKKSPTGNVPFLVTSGSNGGKPTGVAFDVAVTSRTTAQGEGRAKLKIFVVDASADGKLSHEHERVSRISFTVAIDSRLGYEPEGLKSKS